MCYIAVSTPVFEREERYIPLPPPLSTNKDITLNILHDPYQISRQLWRAYGLKSTEEKSDSTVLILTNHPIVVKLTFTNHDDGVSVLEQLVTGVSILLRWSVLQEHVGGQAEEYDLVDGFRQPRYVLEEKFTVRESRLIWWFLTSLQTNHLTTRCLMDYLRKVSADDIRKASSNDNLSVGGDKSE